MDESSEADGLTEEPQNRSASENADGTPVNPRKRKKSSRACDFCHVNHQPCDNVKPRCGYCLKHNKTCLYLRPQKKRGPAQGYRTALHSLRESAAAWGAALNLVPSLSPVLEGYLKQPEGQRLIKAVRDPQQQEFFIQAWQQSSVFKTFFGSDATDAANSVTNGSCSTGAAASIGQTSPFIPKALELAPDLDLALSQQFLPSQSAPHNGRPSLSLPPLPPLGTIHSSGFSLSDIVAKDAARSAQGFDHILGSLGFAPNEGMDDFLAMSFNPEPLEHSSDPEPSLGSEMDQKAYYELLMGKQFT